ncbi:hypothetical protein E1180_09745 [Roseibium denhamense]|uniref:DUF6455 domain-containing protein n=1 Tax=Roseibium denhamense TaxID=76305 RepID=A0ABY1PND7_9HYPH|nr:DUF6455 family protein [Roseibium denhamense]MTI05798.1 hypothetical protein [Roseibium denhamense]SMP37032.1 hypothetical protein SAMN06265374_4468 [Roseibium denhamense]
MNWMDRLNERAGLMGRMLETIGAMEDLPGSDLSDMTMRSAAQRCMRCENTKACSNWLDQNTAGAPAAPDTCPNAALFNSWLKVS